MAIKEKIKLIRIAMEDVEVAKANEALDASAGLFILAIILPSVAVAIYTNLGMPTVRNILWT